MTHRNIKIGATAFVLVGAFIFLLYSSLQSGVEYYKHVDEVMEAAFPGAAVLEFSSAARG